MFARKSSFAAKAAEAPSIKERLAEHRKRELDALARKTVRRATRLLKSATAGDDHCLTNWEDEFLSDVVTRIEKYGAAFKDPEKGQAGTPLSFKQAAKMREINRSVRTKKEKMKKGSK